MDAIQRRNFFTHSEYLTISNCVFNFNILALVVFELQGVPNLRQGAPCPLYVPQGKIFVPEASTLQCLMAFSISTFQLLYFPRYQGSQIYTRGPYAPWTPPIGEIFLTKASTSQYLIVFIISTFQLQQFPRFQGVPNLRQVPLCPFVRPLAEKFLYSRRVLYYV